MNPTNVFEDKRLDSEYRRWLQITGAEGRDGLGSNAPSTLDVHDVLYAHFLIVEFFLDEGKGLGGYGPIDSDAGGLLSTLSRQTTSYGKQHKWSDPMEIAATALFGLVHNHPFHDANKRTALLSTLLLLHRQHRAIQKDVSALEELIVTIARHEVDRDEIYEVYRLATATRDDAEVFVIAYRLKKMTRALTSNRHIITYRQLKQLLHRHDYDLVNPRNNRIDVIRRETGKRVYRMGFPGMTREVPLGELKWVRNKCKLAKRHGYDNGAFYQDMPSTQNLLAEYADPLRRLADR